MSRGLPDARLTDALKELGSLGTAHGVSMLARMVGSPVMMDVPRLALGDSEWLLAELGGPGTPVVAAELLLSGAFEARLFWALPEGDACVLAARLLRVPKVEPALPRPAVDALTEASNVIASAYADAVARLLKVKLSPSPPDLVEGDAAALAGDSSERKLVVQARFFSVEMPAYSGQLILRLESGALEVLTPLLERLGHFGAAAQTPASPF